MNSVSAHVLKIYVLPAHSINTPYILSINSTSIATYSCTNTTHVGLIVGNPKGGCGEGPSKPPPNPHACRRRSPYSPSPPQQGLLATGEFVGVVPLNFGKHTLLFCQMLLRIPRHPKSCAAAKRTPVFLSHENALCVCVCHPCATWPCYSARRLEWMGYTCPLVSHTITLPP